MSSRLERDKDGRPLAGLAVHPMPDPMRTENGKYQRTRPRRKGKKHGTTA